jgi:small GTP-binding protein
MPEITKKVCLCGDNGVGKTSLIKRFVVGKYDEGYISTLGTVVSKKSVPTGYGSTLMMIWDISGQKEFKRIQASAFKNAGGGIAVCDLTRPETAKNLGNWIGTLREHAGDDIPVIVFANKLDLVGVDSDAPEDVLRLSRSLGCVMMGTSAKTGANVEKGFMTLASQITAQVIGDRPWHRAAPDDGGQFENSAALIDYMIDQFCGIFGDEEIGMHIIRKQVRDFKINFENANKADVDKLAERFVALTLEFKGQEAGIMLRSKIGKAKERTNW